MEREVNPGYPVLIIGAGRGGTALLEMFLEEPLVNVVAIADTNPDAPGLLLARQHGIATFADAASALQHCKQYPDCIVYNLSHDDTVADMAQRIFGDKRVAGGAEVKLFWQIIVNLKQVKLDLEQSQKKLAHLAHHDFLTGLPNRAHFFKILARSIARSGRSGAKLAVMFLDLDGFKKINDTLGHAAGDLLLQGVAQRLQETVRQSDVVARIGGDEFVLLLENVSGAENAAAVAQKIIANLATPFDLNGTPGRVTASIGIALYPQHGESTEELLRRADEAMYQCKQSGKNTYRFTPD